MLASHTDHATVTGKLWLPFVKCVTYLTVFSILLSKFVSDSQPAVMKPANGGTDESCRKHQFVKALFKNRR